MLSDGPERAIKNGRRVKIPEPKPAPLPMAKPKKVKTPACSTVSEFQSANGCCVKAGQIQVQICAQAQV